MRRGFTMIELIFVIVILGILAAVAIPRLAATRDDAQIAKGLSEVSTAISDFGAHYTSQGSFSTDPAKMTSVPVDTATITFGTAFNYQTDNAGALESCIAFTLTADGNLTVGTVSGASGGVCKGIQGAGALKKLLGTKQFGGSAVKFN